jgi:hypothetical protein
MLQPVAGTSSNRSLPQQRQLLEVPVRVRAPLRGAVTQRVTLGHLLLWGSEQLPPAKLQNKLKYVIII